jgi:hypothetical protein
LKPEGLAIAYRRWTWGRAAAVLETVDAFAAHKVVLNSAKIDPDMRELVNEERACVEKDTMVFRNKRDIQIQTQTDSSVT